MKKTYLLKLFVLLFTSNFSYAQFTAIPDANFEQALVDLGIDDVMDGQVFLINTYSVTTLDVANKEITNLTGINAFYSLEYLDISHNNLTTVDLSSLPNLQTLRATNMNLESLDVSANTNLTELFCYTNDITNLVLSSSLVYLNASYNDLTTIDLSPCALLEDVQIGFNNLEVIDVSQNPLLLLLTASNNTITSVDISNNLGLENLRLQHNPLVNIDPSANSNLKVLRLGNTAITDLDVTNNSQLSTLYIPNNPQFTSSLDVSQNTLLTDFYATGTPLSCVQVENLTNALNNVDIYQWWEIDEMSTYSDDCFDTIAIPDPNFEQALIDQGFDDVIDGMVFRYIIHEVTHLFLTNYNIDDLTGIEAFKSLNFLQASGNNLTSIDLSQNIDLIVLNLDNNQLQTLDISENAELEELRCANNNLTTLDVSANTSLELLLCHSNAITELVVPSSIVEIFGYDNQLDNLDIEHCIDLEFLALSNNMLTQLDLQNNVNLEILFLENNLLNELDVSNNINLLSLNASYNSISEIFLENCLLLEELRFYNSTLEAIDVSNNTNLEMLHVSSNNLATIDVSQNVALQYFLAQLNPNLGEELDLSNNPTLTTVNLTDTNVSCIKVTDEVAATNNEGLYTYWLIPDSAMYTETTCDVLSVEHVIADADMAIFPNPASDYLNITISNSAYSESISRIQIIEITGKIVFNANNFIERINLQSMAQGLYILQIQSSRYATETRKIIIK
ncbi:T9SS type A sorting domain-containing protein [Lacinutrix iliipiscaria]|uniref:T9SS type A sorting domain-containing protein n=1 Tax=Lacinutrix iliipiscaria TaxID=1230532 RepID=A0ABW5WJ48_9FLAO